MEAAAKFTTPYEAFDARLIPIEIADKRRRLSLVLPELRDRLSPCKLCPQECAADRQHGGLGECGLDENLRIASVARHTGEEPPISGDQGAINVFFSGCNLHCLHCQNWAISQQHVGQVVTPLELAEKILAKWLKGAHTLGWVTPTPQIVSALEAYQLCLEQGLDLPLVYNSGGYESAGVVELLAGIVDIWLPDAKTASNLRSHAIQRVCDYPAQNLAALSAMVDQVDRSLARAVIVRHLVLPEGLADSKKVLAQLWHNFGSRIHLSLMGQYFPTYKTEHHPALGRRIGANEYSDIVEFAQTLGFERGWVQNFEEEDGIPLHCLS